MNNNLNNYNDRYLNSPFRTVLSRTPMRISLVGGGTDFIEYYSKSPGKVISCSINKYLYVIIKERPDEYIVLNHFSHEVIVSIESIKHDIIRECLRFVGINKSIEITIVSDLTAYGTGLGSSSSLTVGLLNALYCYKDTAVTNETLARNACKIEIDILGKPIGKQDQYITAYGGFKKIIFFQDESVQLIDYNFSNDEIACIDSNLFLYFTNYTRKSEDILSSQKFNSSTNINHLNHICSLVEELDNHLMIKDYSIIGNILKYNWIYKKKLSPHISSVEIDYMVNLALRNGSEGCKIAGAGGGGYLLCYVNKINQMMFKKALSNYSELTFCIEHEGTKIIHTN